VIDDLDLLAPAAPAPADPPKRRGRPPGSKNKPKPPADDRDWGDEEIDHSFEPDLEDPDVQIVLKGGFPDPGAFLRPVGVTFIGTVLGIEPRRLHHRLRNCPVIGRQPKGRFAGAPLYDFKEAMRHCVEPRMDLETMFRSMSNTTMPPIIMKAFWEGVRAKNKVMEETGHYWHDADVLRILGDVQMEIKDATLLWIEDLPGKANLSTEDYQALRGKVGELLGTIQARITEWTSERATRSVVTEIQNDIDDGKLSLHGGG